MPDSNLTEREPHDEAEELLPWYASGQLDAADRAKVDAHLSSCAHCRQQLAIEHKLIDEFQAMSPEVESGWVRLQARLNVSDAAAQFTPAPRRAARQNVFAEIWEMLSRPAVAGIAIAQLAFVVVAGSVLLSLSRPTYRALGSAPPPVSANLIVMFRADATIEEVRHSLNAAGASIVDGPTPSDAYLLHVAPQRRAAALTKLQSDSNVQLAQPIDGAQS